MDSAELRAAEGRAMRGSVPRSSHAQHERDPALDPVDLLISQEQGRIESLIPVRRQRMSESPFAFFRAGALLMARDLAATPRTGILVQASGDAHVSNFGWYASPERDLVFDTNDFDETLVAAWEWDVKRLASSFVIAGRDNGFGKRSQSKAARSAVRAYQSSMRRFADMPVLELWYQQVRAQSVLERLDAAKRTHDLRRARKSFKKASKKDSRHVLGKLGEKVDGKYRIIDDPPFVVPLRSAGFPLKYEDVADQIRAVFDSYLETVSRPIRTLMSRFTLTDIALKVVGVGSVGTRCYIALFQGNGPEDVLFLQIKEAGPSVLEETFGHSMFDHDGQRVVEGQRLMQTTSDIMLGWTAATRSTTQYYVRQLKDMKASANLSKMDAEDMKEYASVCGRVLANAHARSGDPALIAGYIGSSDTFANAITDYAVRYADQNDEDYAAFISRVPTPPSS